MPVEYREWITRIDIQKEPDKYFLFGDNLHQVGLGGQAYECRGEPNAIGIPTKKMPSMKEESFFTEDDYIEAVIFINRAFNRIPKDATIVVPCDKEGNHTMGTGLSQLPIRAPKIYDYITEKINSFEVDYTTLKIYMVDITTFWNDCVVESRYFSSLTKCRTFIFKFKKSLKEICDLYEVNSLYKEEDNIYEYKEWYEIQDISEEMVLYNCIVKKLKIY